MGIGDLVVSNGWVVFGSVLVAGGWVGLGLALAVSGYGLSMAMVGLGWHRGCGVMVGMRL